MKNNYTLKWVIQRITALFLIPLSLWFVYKCISFQNLNFFELREFFKSYINSSLFFIMMSTMLIHSKLGFDTIIQDYISSSYLKKICKASINLISFFSLLIVFLAIVRLAIF